MNQSGGQVGARAEGLRGRGRGIILEGDGEN